MLTLTTFTQYTIGSPSQSNQARKIRNIQIGKKKKKEVKKLSLCADNTVLHMENSKDFPKRL